MKTKKTNLVKQLTIRIPASEYEALRKLSACLEGSVSQITRIILRAAFVDAKGKKAGEIRSALSRHKNWERGKQEEATF